MAINLKLGEVCLSNGKCRRIPHNFNARLHWAERSRWNKEWKDAVRDALLEQVGPTRPRTPLEHPTVRFTLYQVHLADEDNLRGSIKPLLDALKPSGVNLIEDDGPDYIRLVVSQQKVSKRAEEHVEISIEEQITT